MNIVLGRVGSVAVAALYLCVLSAQAAPRSLTFQNMSGESISGITITDRQNPEHVVMPPLASLIAADDVVDVPLDVVEGVCLHDISYVYSSGKTVLQENIDLCSTDALIVE